MLPRMQQLAEGVVEHPSATPDARLEPKIVSPLSGLLLSALLSKRL